MPREMIFDKKNVIVIGGAGFIGSHLCDELIKTSKVICIDNFITGQEKNIDHLLAEPDFEFVKHDICTPIDLLAQPELRKFKIEFQGVQEIYNLACPMSVKDFEANKIDIMLANSLGMKNSLDLAKQFKSKFLQFSSSVVYGHREAGDPPVKEGDLRSVDHLSLRGAYDEGKRFAETMTETYRKCYGLDTKIIRLFRVFGPRMMLNDGQMVPDFIDNALSNEDLEIFGDEGFVSSFCYVSDCIDAALKVMESDIAEPINIGSDVEVRLNDVAKKIIDMIGSRSQIKFSPELLFMKPLNIPDISKAKNEMGWMPVVPLDKGLENTIYELRASKGLKGVEHAI